MLFAVRSILPLLLASFAIAGNTGTPYIVVCKPGLLSSLLQTIAQLVGVTLSPLNKFQTGNGTSSTFNGFNANLTPAQVALLRANPNVQYVETDGTLHTAGVINKTPHAKRYSVTESPSSWGLGRISHAVKGSTQYVYDSTAGAGTCIYVLDSGIYTSHSDFGGRATTVQNYVTSEASGDLSGHGTAVAAAAIGTLYGAAKSSNAYSLKVCDQNGNCAVSSVVAAISAATNDAKSRSCPNGVIINLSLGGPSAGWQSVKDAIVAAAQTGAFVVAAAGNVNANANGYLPASAAGACAVGATDINDAIASFSNYGSVLAVFAPGVGIQTAGISSTTASVTVDGTSMSAPYVAGLGAYLWGKNGKGTGAAGVALCNTIKTTANSNAVTGSLGGSPNKLAYNGAA